MLRGRARAEQGLLDEGLAELLQGLASWRRGGLLGLPDYLPMLAEVNSKRGQTGLALDAIAEALATVSKTEERRYEAELHRMRGELQLQEVAQRNKTQSVNLSLSIKAEACFHHAIGIARSQRAKSLELRAVVSLSRLWQAQGKGAEARERLAEVHAWFTEGSDTSDLQEAKTLLATLT